MCDNKRCKNKGNYVLDLGINKYELCDKCASFVSKIIDNGFMSKVIAYKKQIEYMEKFEGLQDILDMYRNNKLTSKMASDIIGVKTEVFNKYARDNNIFKYTSIKHYSEQEGKPEEEPEIQELSTSTCSNNKCKNKGIKRKYEISLGSKAYILCDQCAAFVQNIIETGFITDMIEIGKQREHLNRLEGMDDIISKYIGNELTIKLAAAIVGVSEGSFINYIRTHKITKYSKIKKSEDMEIDENANDEELAKLLKPDMKIEELTVRRDFVRYLESKREISKCLPEACRRCAFLNTEINHCYYTMATNKRIPRNGNVCTAFVDKGGTLT